MTKTLLIVIGIACAVLVLSPLLSYGVPNSSHSRSTGAVESGFMDDDGSSGLNIDTYTILLTLTIMLLLAIIIDALATKKKNKLTSQIHKAREEIKSGTHIVKNNQSSIGIKSIQWASFALFVFILVAFIFVLLDSVFWIHADFKFVYILTAILVLLLVKLKMLSAREREKRPIIIKKSGALGTEGRNILILIGMACAVIGAYILIIWQPLSDSKQTSQTYLATNQVQTTSDASGNKATGVTEHGFMDIDYFCYPPPSEIIRGETAFFLIVFTLILLLIVIEVFSLRKKKLRNKTS